VDIVEDASLKNGRRLLWRYLAPQGAAVAFLLLLFLVGAGLQVAAPQVVRGFIDGAQAAAPLPLLMRMALVFIVVTVVQKLTVALAAYWAERVGWEATNALRVDLAAHLIGLDLGFHRAHAAGEWIERIDGDVSRLAAFLSSFLAQLVANALLLIGILVAASLVDVRMGLVCAGVALLALAFLTWIPRFSVPYLRRERTCSAEFYGYVAEAMGATLDVRACGAEPYVMRRFYEHLRRWRPAKWRARVWGDTVWMAAIAVFAVGAALAYGFGGSLYLAGTISLGSVYLLVAYTAMLAEPLEAIRTQAQEWQQATANIGRVRELFQIRSRLADGRHTLPSGALTVEFRGVYFAYSDGEDLEGLPEGERGASLDGISFALEAGHVLGILGRTGSGKTTMARLLFRMYDPQQGQVLLSGMDLRDARLESLRSRVGLVTQEVQIFAASLRDNITLFDPSVPDEYLLAALQKLGLEPWLGRLPDGLDTMLYSSGLSAGEAQLVALARLFIKDPGLIILDEASSRLDPATEALLGRALGELCVQRTVVIIAHHLASVERADDILILDDGQIVEHGARARLAADPGSRFAWLRQSGL
jgi:ABC-type multidrug transport system fused ATPase/permease subunit